MNIALLLSGGVDSAVATHLLMERGLRPDLYYIKIGMDGDDELTCTAEEDLELCQAVARRYGLPLEVVDLQKEYWDRVVTYTMDHVRRGLTPNPDVMCNRLIKFGAFEERVGPCLRPHLHRPLRANHSRQRSLQRSPLGRSRRSQRPHHLARHRPRSSEGPNRFFGATRIVSSREAHAPARPSAERRSAPHRRRKSVGPRPSQRLARHLFLGQDQLQRLRTSFSR